MTESERDAIIRATTEWVRGAGIALPAQFFPPAPSSVRSKRPKRYRSVIGQTRRELGGDFLSVEEVAEILNLSRDTVTRRFEKLEGVIDLGHEESRRKRRYRKLRIPRSLLDRFLKERTRRNRGR
jgi:biotin operon repressor